MHKFNPMIYDEEIGFVRAIYGTYSGVWPILKRFLKVKIYKKFHNFLMMAFSGV